MRSTQVSNNKRRSNNKFNQKSISKNIINTLEKKIIDCLILQNKKKF